MPIHKKRKVKSHRKRKIKIYENSKGEKYVLIDGKKVKLQVKKVPNDRALQIIQKLISQRRRR